MDPQKHAPLRISDIRSKYKVVDKVGKGTYGTVFKVLNLQDNKFYAIKKFQNTEAKLQVEGFPITALRQISLLKQLNHPNIVNLKEIICSKPNKRNLYRGSTFMVFEYMHHDFAGLFRSKVKFTMPEIKSIMKQLIEGCNFLHKNKVMHRDIKSANILMNDQGIVQLADFGLGRRTRFDSVYTYKVVTLWYRAPELLLGCKTYNHKVDVWSIGCVLAELLTTEVLFKKETQYAIIEKIYQICGDLDENQYTEEYLRVCVYYNDMKPKKQYKNTLTSFIRKLCPEIDLVTIDFLKGLLELNPYRRLSCQEALEHDFFKKQPKACSPQEIQKLDVQYHEMFRDRSLKIQRKERKVSLDWSEQEEKKKGKEQSKQEKESKPNEKEAKTYPRNDKYKYNYKNNQRIRYPNQREVRYDRYDDRKKDDLRKDYSSSYKKHDDYKSRKKYSRSPSRSRNSSSSSSSLSKRNKNKGYKKPHYDVRDDRKTYRKQGEYFEKEKGEITSWKKQNGNHFYPQKSRDRNGQTQKDRHHNEKDYKVYEKKNQSYKLQNTSNKEESHFFKEKAYNYKQRDRRQSEYDDRKHENYRETSRYSKNQHEGSYQRNPSKNRYPDEEKSKSYTKQKYESSEYRGKDEYLSHDRDQLDRYSKPYPSREIKQQSRKQHYESSSKYHQERRPYRSPQRDRQYQQYRQYEKSSYDYQRKQSRNKEDSRYKEESRARDQYKKVSIQYRQSVQRKKHSPKKNIHINEY